MHAAGQMLVVRTEASAPSCNWQPLSAASLQGGTSPDRQVTQKAGRQAEGQEREEKAGKEAMKILLIAD